MEIQKESYEDTELKARDLYKAINRVWCLPLDAYVVFDRQGFHHLIVKKNIPRPKSERKRRFALLPYAQDILKNPDTIISHKIKNIRKSQADFWIFSGKTNDLHIKVVVRQIGSGKKHFFSIYGKKQKSTP
ncbi:MAG TPA: hypothetical protein VIJ46_00825 [Rhabdochlamydiaceae bacterium]